MTERGTAMRIPEPAVPTHIAPHPPQLHATIAFRPQRSLPAPATSIYSSDSAAQLPASFAALRDYPEMKTHSEMGDITVPSRVDQISKRTKASARAKSQEKNKRAGKTHQARKSNTTRPHSVPSYNKIPLTSAESSSNPSSKSDSVLAPRTIGASRGNDSDIPV